MDSYANLLDSWVEGAIFKLLSWVNRVDIMLVGDNILLVFALGDVSQHAGILRLGEGQLVVDQVPNRFT